MRSFVNELHNVRHFATCDYDRMISVLCDGYLLHGYTPEGHNWEKNAANITIMNSS